MYRQPSGASVLAEVAERLAALQPQDRARVELATYPGLHAPWNNWEHLALRGAHWSTVLARVALDGAA